MHYIRCIRCLHEWGTDSNKLHVVCPNCGKHTPNYLSGHHSPEYMAVVSDAPGRALRARSPDAWYAKIKRHLEDVVDFEPEDVEAQLRLCAGMDMCLRTGMEIPEECLTANICVVECSAATHLDLWCFDRTDQLLFKDETKGTEPR